MTVVTGSLHEQPTALGASVGALFVDRVAATPDKEAFRAPAAGGGWRSLTWRQTGEDVTALAAGLISLDVAPQEPVAIASSTRLEWILIDLAIGCAAAATTTVYPSMHADDVAFVLTDSGTRVLFAEDDEQVVKIQAERHRVPGLAHVVVIDGHAAEGVITLDQLRERGRALLARSPDVVSERIAGIGPEDIATVIYTSGTTGRPKGVELPQRCWTYEAAAIDALGVLGPDDVHFLWLPLAHCFGKVFMSAQLQIGFLTAVDGRVDKLVENLAVVQPTFVAGVPRIFEKVHARVVQQATEGGGAKARIFEWAFGVGQRAAAVEREGGSVGGLLAAQRSIADRLVFHKIKARLGGKLRFFVSGSARLSPEIGGWFQAAGIVVLQGYGLTETSASITVNVPDTNDVATVGAPLPGTEIRLAEDGELLVRGPSVMRGYRNRPDLTAEVLDADGWLSTGDIGDIDEAGRVRITDRKKDIVKLSTGKYLAPQAIEAEFKALCPLVANFLVHVEGRSFATALVTLDAEALTAFAEARSLAPRGNDPLAGWSQSEAVHAEVAKAVDELNSRLNSWETIKDFRILERDFTVEDGEITPSMKMRRRALEERYSDVLDSMYANH